MVYRLYTELKHKNMDRNNTQAQDACCFCSGGEGNGLETFIYCFKKKKKVLVANKKETICLLWAYVCLLQCGLYL